MTSAEPGSSERVYVERIVNLHIHTTASDGTGDLPALVEAARAAGVDVLIVTDHNVYRPEEAGWRDGTLVLMGEELNSPSRPHENHLLVFGAGEDLAPYAEHLQEAIDAARQHGALPIIAHPIEHSGARANEPEIDWVDREVTGLLGLELWNYMSEFKSYIHTLSDGLLFAFAPRLAIRGPYPETLRLWDQMLARGRAVAVGGSDAHASLYALGPLRRRIFSYRYLFSAVNTHLLLDRDWTGVLDRDERTVLSALNQGRCFVAYDRAAPAAGTRFTAERAADRCTFGETLAGTGPARLSVSLPARARITLLCNGTPVAETDSTALEHTTTQAGVYRFEARRRFGGHPVGWIFGNPIWLA